MFERVLVVCDGNICRSPTAACLLAQRTGRQVRSAGLVGLTGSDMDTTAREVAAAHGIRCPVHQARKLSAQMCRDADLILVMETRQKDAVMRLAPEASGKVMLLSYWSTQQDIPDPYRRSRDVYEHVYQLIEAAVRGWQARLGPGEPAGQRRPTPRAEGNS